MTLRFNSLLNPSKYGFVYESSDTDHWDICYRSSSILSYRSFYFETYGDGTCQHTPISPVPLGEISVDWLLSLAKHLLNSPAEYDWSMDSLFGYGLPQPDLAQFLAGLKEKHINQYFSPAERAVTKAESKRFDKRWFKIPSWPFQRNCTVQRCYELFHSAHEDPCRMIKAIETVGALLAIADGLDDTGDRYFSACSLEKMEWLTSDLLSACRALRDVIQALESLRNSGNAVDCYIRNLTPKAESVAA